MLVCTMVKDMAERETIAADKKSSISYMYFAHAQYSTSMEVLWRCIYFIAVFTLVASSTEEPRHGQFTAELMGSELVVGTICKSSWTWSEDGPCQV